MEYTREEIEIFKRVIKDYEIIKKEIDNRINKGYKIEELLDYIRHLASCNITNCEINNNDINRYFDFNYCDMCISIYQDNEEDTPYLGDTIEIWNDKESYYLGTFNNIKEIKDIIGDE